MENEKEPILCSRCYDEVTELFEPKCEEKPELLTAEAIGMYHCPDCGTMLLAGLPHGKVCALCRDLNHPMFDAPKGSL